MKHTAQQHLTARLQRSMQRTRHRQTPHTEPGLLQLPFHTQSPPLLVPGIMRHKMLRHTRSVPLLPGSHHPHIMVSLLASARVIIHTVKLSITPHLNQPQASIIRKPQVPGNIHRPAPLHLKLHTDASLRLQPAHLLPKNCTLRHRIKSLIRRSRELLANTHRPQRSVLGSIPRLLLAAQPPHERHNTLEIPLQHLTLRPASLIIRLRQLIPEPRRQPVAILLSPIKKVKAIIQRRKLTLPLVSHRLAHHHIIIAGSPTFMRRLLYDVPPRHHRVQSTILDFLRTLRHTRAHIRHL